MAQLDSGDPREVGPYRIVARVGEGGMGRVYLGLSPGGRRVAVKVMHARFAAVPEYRQRFRREVEAARQVGGFLTALVLEAEPDAVVPWMATQYIDAPSLWDTVQRSGPLHPARVCDLGSALAEGLAVIHKSGLVHRDLKPGNILMASDGPRIIDFGVAQADGATRVTQAGAVVGTPEYMSPEQLDDGNVGPPSDVFALGSVLAYAATGRSPFGASAVSATTYAILHKPPDLGSLPGPLRDIIAGCLAKDPAGRPTPASLVTAFAALAGSFPVSGPTPGRSPRPEQAVATVTPTPSPRQPAGARLLPPHRERPPRPRPPGPPHPRLQVRPAAGSWWHLAADPAGRWIAASDGDGISLWDPGSALPLRSWPVGALVRALAASDGNWLGTATGHGEVQVWDVETGTACASVSLRRDVSALALDWPAGLIAEAGGDDGILRVWDVADVREAALLAELPCPARPAALSFDDTGSRVAAGCEDGGLRVWDLAQARLDGSAGTQQVQSGPVLAVGWDPAGSRWLTAGADGFGHPSAAAVSAAGHGALIDGRPGHVHVFSLDAPDRLRRLKGTGTTLAGAALAGPGLLVTGGADGALHVWDAGRHALRTFPSPGRAITAVAAAPDGARVAVCDDSPRVTVYDVIRGGLVERWRKDSGKPAVAAAFSPDGSVLATAGDAVRVWEASSGAGDSLPQDGAARVKSVAFDSTGKYLAAAGTDGVVRVWQGTRLRHALTGHKGDVYAVAFVPDGRLVSAGSDATIRTWDLTAGKQRDCDDLGCRVRVLAVHPADGSLAAGCADGTVRLCAPPRWSDAGVLGGHVHCVTSACFAADGGLLVTASLDGTARVWNLATRSAQLVLAPDLDGWAAAVGVGDGRYQAHGPAEEYIWQALGLDRQPLLAPEAEEDHG